jgi:hypothetical protein
MSQIVISEFFVTRNLVLIDDVKNIYSESKCIKAFCRNKKAFPFLKNIIKKWLPVHFKWISSHCQDIEFMRKNENKINYKELSKNTCVNYILDILERHLDELDWNELSKNTSAVHLLKKYRKRICWSSACDNTSTEMIDFLSLPKNFPKIVWSILSCNPSAIDLLKKHLNMIDKTGLNLNPKGFEILKDHTEMINFAVLCNNQSKEAMEIIEKNINHPSISFELLSSNSYAIDILKKHKDKIDWYMTIDNENIGELFKAFPDKISSLIIKYVVKYPSVIPYLKDYIYDISYIKLAENPGIFTVDDNDYNLRLKTVQNIISNKFRI